MAKRKYQLGFATKLRILEEIKRFGYKPTLIASLLRHLNVNKFHVIRVYKTYKETTSVARRLGSGRKSKITPQMLQIVNEQMLKDDETTAYQLHNLLNSRGFEISLRTVLRARTKLGWVFRGSKYCQFIKKPNIEYRKIFAERLLKEMANGYDFGDLIFTDETKIQMQIHKKKCCRRIGFQPKLKRTYKHPADVMAWAGISKEGRTKIVIFKCTMNSEVFQKILEKSLLPFAQRKYCGKEWKLMQDNGTPADILPVFIFFNLSLFLFQNLIYRVLQK